jgi:hypothetical protein
MPPLSLNAKLKQRRQHGHSQPRSLAQSALTDVPSGSDMTKGYVVVVTDALGADFRSEA